MNKKENISKATEELEKITNDKSKKNKFDEILKLEKKYPDDVGILQVISKNYLAIGKNTKALNYLLKAKSVDPKNYSIYYKKIIGSVNIVQFILAIYYFFFLHDKHENYIVSEYIK